MAVVPTSQLHDEYAKNDYLCIFSEFFTLMVLYWKIEQQPQNILHTAL
jgi:hypothetical protein